MASTRKKLVSANALRSTATSLAEASYPGCAFHVVLRQLRAFGSPHAFAFYVLAPAARLEQVLPRPRGTFLATQKRACAPETRIACAADVHSRVAHPHPCADTPPRGRHRTVQVPPTRPSSAIHRYTPTADARPVPPPSDLVSSCPSQQRRFTRGSWARLLSSCGSPLGCTLSSGSVPRGRRCPSRCILP